MLFRTSQWSSLFRWGKWPPSFLLMNGEVSFKDELNPKNKCEWMFDKLGKWNWTMSLDRRYVGIVWWNILINCPECLITSELSFTFNWNVLISITDSLKYSCLLLAKLSQLLAPTRRKRFKLSPWELRCSHDDHRHSQNTKNLSDKEAKIASIFCSNICRGKPKQKSKRS